MESNEQTELTSKTETTQMESRWQLVRGAEGLEGLSKKEQGLMDMDYTEVIAMGRE